MDRSMVVLVTGATGFVGRHVAHALARRGHEVRCLVRTTADPRPLSAAGFSVARGAMLEQPALDAAVAGVDAVVHVAGLIAARSFWEMRRVNAEGTGRLASACARAAVRPRRFVLVSSLAAAGPSPDGRPLREEDVARPISRYGLSKLLGELAARRALPADVPLTVVRPPAVYGPHDRGLLAFFQAAARGVLLRIGTTPRRVSIVHGEDLAEAIASALDSPAAAGRTYFVADPEAHCIDELLTAIARAVGRPTREVRLPEAFVRLAGALAEEAARWRGVTPLFSRDKAAEFLAPGWVCDPSRAQRELGWAPSRTLSEGLAETARWYRANGWLGGAQPETHVVT
jgi:nucleoside-diphosphate-sugar epimerase